MDFDRLIDLIQKTFKSSKWFYFDIFFVEFCNFACKYKISGLSDKLLESVSDRLTDGRTTEIYREILFKILYIQFKNWIPFSLPLLD